MAATKVDTKTSSNDGWKKVDSKPKFIKFDKEGDTAEGIFVEVAETVSRKYGNKQVVWIFADNDGEIQRMSEKTMMTDLRLKLKAGDKFKIVYTGLIDPEDGGSSYKGFDMYVA